MENEYGTPNYKWNFAMGTTSRVPGSALHYLIMDIDNLDLEIFITIQRLKKRYPCEVKLQATEHGWHVFTSLTGVFGTIVRIARQFGADENWLKIGIARGYLFLADKASIKFPWPVERMRLSAKKEGQEINAGRAGLSIPKKASQRG